jgi:hypothetical protein
MIYGESKDNNLNWQSLLLLILGFAVTFSSFDIQRTYFLKRKWKFYAKIKLIDNLKG